jgi:hypothetical protein
MNSNNHAHTVPKPDDLDTNDDRFRVNAFGIKIEVMSNAERIAKGYAPIPENFICCFEPPGPRLVEGSDDEL